MRLGVCKLQFELGRLSACFSCSVHLEEGLCSSRSVLKHSSCDFSDILPSVIFGLTTNTHETVSRVDNFAGRRRKSTTEEAEGVPDGLDGSHGGARCRRKQ